MKKTILFAFVTFCITLKIAANDVRTFYFDYNKIREESCVVLGKEYKNFTYEGLPQYTQQNKPSIPVQYIRLSVPYNAVDFKILVESEDSREFGVVGEDIYINPENNEKPLGNFDYCKNYPEVQAEIVGQGFYAGQHKILTIALYPICINGFSNKITFYPSIRYNISYSVIQDFDSQNLNPIITSSNTKSVEFDASILLNPEDVEANASPNFLINPFSVDRNEEYEYVIITSSKYSEQARRLAAWKRIKGYSTNFYYIENILSDQNYINGDRHSCISDDAGKLRAFLENLYINCNTRYVLLAGEDIPFRYGKSDCMNVDHQVMPSDLYYSDLNSNWDTNNNGIYGEPKDMIDYNGELYVGRLPVKKASEFDCYIDKLKIYEYNPGNGDASYLGKSFMSRQYGNIITWGYFYNAQVSEYYKLFGKQNIFDYTDNGVDWPTGADVVNFLKTHPVGCHNFIGHGSPAGVAVQTVDANNKVYHSLLAMEGKNFYAVPEIGNGLNNINLKHYPAWSYSISCTTMPFDIFKQYNVSKNFGASYVLGDNYGGVAFIGNTRDSWFPAVKDLFISFFSELNKKKTDNNYTDYVTAGYMTNFIRCAYPKYHHENLIRNLLGDPLVNLWLGEPSILSYEEHSNGKYDRFEYVPNGLNKEKYILSSVLLDDLHFASREIINKEDLDTVSWFNNRTYTLYEKNTLPLILPTRIQNFSTSVDGKSFIVGNDIFCGRLVNPFREEGLVTFSNGSNVNIEAIGKVMMNSGTVFDSNSFVHIVADKEVSFNGDVTLKKNSIVIINSSDTVFFKGTIVEPYACLSVNAKKVVIYDDVDFSDKASINFYSEPEIRSTKRNGKAQNSYLPLVIDGRTWWYTSCHIDESTGQRVRALAGIRIGESEVIDGVSWNKLVCDKYAESMDSGESWQLVDSLFEMGYIRETDKKVYLRISIPVSDTFPLGMMQTLNTWLTEINKYEREGRAIIKIYDFNVGQGDEFNYGFEDFSYLIRVASEEDIKNSGSIFHKYSAEILRNPYGYPVNNEWYEYVEVIGRENGVFFMPIHSYSPSEIGWNLPTLCYVTDSDGSVIYEGDGGCKLWELDSLDEFKVESPVEYYNLQGMPIASPGKGLYIMRQNSKSSMIFIK